MVRNLLKDVGLTQERLGRLTGQAKGTVSDKFRGKSERGVRLGAREAGVIACFRVMDDSQRAAVDEAFDTVLSEFGDGTVRDPSDDD